MMKINKKTKIWAIVSAVVLLATFIVSRLFLLTSGAAGGYLVLGVVIALLVWKVFLGNDAEQVRDLRKRNRDLERELSEKNSSRLNVVELNPILHVAVLKVDTSFVRPYVREEGKSTFNGALRADLSVEYGVKLEESGYRYDKATDTLVIANFNPGIISYSKKQLNWEFARTFRAVSMFGHQLYEVSDKDSDRTTAQMCEKLRSELEAEIDSRNVSEFDWLSPLIADQVQDVVRLMLGRPDLKIELVKESEGEFLPLSDVRRLITSGQ